MLYDFYDLLRFRREENEVFLLERVLGWEGVTCLVSLVVVLFDFDLVTCQDSVGWAQGMLL